VYRFDVPAKVLADQFSHLSEDESFDGFFCYRGNWYHTSDFMSVTAIEALKGWQGYTNDSYFSGVVVKFSDDFEQVKTGTYFS
jgi:hypothetical protein